MEWRVWPGEWYLDAGALMIALALDLTLRELPNSAHPVAWMGKLIMRLEGIGPSKGRRVAAFLWGVCIAILVPALSGALVWLVANWLRELGVVFYVAGCAVLLSTTFAVRGLAGAARNVQAAMDDGSVNEARRGLESLVSRDANSLSRPLVAAAAIESVAENTTDSYIGPWLSFAILGLPGAFAYRAINTLDSMIGYRGKYEYLGKASARLDDAINFVPARLSAAFMVASGALCGMSARMGCTWVWRGRVQTASPNAGWTIGAMSGLLGVALEKPGHYRIGDGLRDPCALHIGTSIRVAYAVAAFGMLAALGALTLRGLLTG
ncbi:MAG: cobalamin biosynthesis protein CobD [Dehalococcoidia bacterium]|nr:cobalamin biosynthesis protein CobD [Dehalococcoidia bacterium]